MREFNERVMNLETAFVAQKDLVKTLQATIGTLEKSVAALSSAATAGSARHSFSSSGSADENNGGVQVNGGDGGKKGKGGKPEMLEAIDFDENRPPRIPLSALKTVLKRSVRTDNTFQAYGQALGAICKQVSDDSEHDDTALHQALTNLSDVCDRMEKSGIKVVTVDARLDNCRRALQALQKAALDFVKHHGIPVNHYTRLIKKECERRAAAKTPEGGNVDVAAQMVASA